MGDNELTRTTQLAPDMETVIEAGDTLEIEDREGQKFAVTARESSEVMDFLKAFDIWLTTKNAMVGGIVLDAAYNDMTRKFNNLPMRIQREMPSIRNRGISVPSHH